MVWRKTLGPQLHPSFFQLPFKDWVESNLKAMTPLGVIPWYIIFTIGCWSLWTAGNQTVIGVEEYKISTVVHTIWSKGKDVYKVNKLCVSGWYPLSVRQERLISWSPPPFCWAKLRGLELMRKPTRDCEKPQWGVDWRHTGQPGNLGCNRS
ncbi:hypothetical protein Scep_007413 [Stephania cephalantha]|uniref:Uncharacterized protein n=1 Tax=Stephania cephalantha TaxID=152367 RepID=A0AAP0K9U0_9MAGN